jgi:Ca2+/Na+ antiporter
MEFCRPNVLNNYFDSWNFPAMLHECEANYSTVGFLRLFYGPLARNSTVAIGLVVLIAVVCFLNIKYIADNFFSVSIKNIKQRFQISTVVTSCVVIPIVNGAPDLLCSVAFGEKMNGLQTAVGCLVASFVFSILVIVGFIVRSSRKESIRISKSLYFKELVFYLLSLTLLIAFGIHGKITNALATFYLALYLFYLATTFWWMKPDEFDNLSEVFVAYEHEKQEQKPKETEVRPLAVEVKEHLLGRTVSLQSTLEFPFRLLYALTVPSEANVLMKTKIYPVVEFLSVLTCLWAFGLASNPVLAAFLGYSLATIMVTLARHAENRVIRNTIHEMMTLVCSIAWIKFICSLLMDAILFLSFIVNINQLYLSIFIFSIGNSLQDLFANISLSKMGFEQIAVISTFSGQLCNILLGLWLNAITSGNKSFVLFDSGYQEASQDVGSALIFFFLACAVIVIFCNSIYFTWNDFEYRKSYFWVGLGAYLFFVAASVFHIWRDMPEPNR